MVNMGYNVNGAVYTSLVLTLVRLMSDEAITRRSCHGETHVMYLYINGGQIPLVQFCDVNIGW